MLLIIILGLIAKLALVSGDCDVGTQDVRDFNFYEVADKNWYVTLYSSNEIDNNFDCFDVSYSTPNGNVSFGEISAYDISAKSYVTNNVTVTNWKRTGYYEVYTSVPMFSGRYYFIAIDYSSYAIVKICPFSTNTTDVYVVYRSTNPQQETVNKVLQELKKNNIDVNQLVKRREDNCQYAV